MALRHRWHNRLDVNSLQRTQRAHALASHRVLPLQERADKLYGAALRCNRHELAAM